MKATRVTLKVKGRTFTMFVNNYHPERANTFALSAEGLCAAVRIFLRQTVVPSLGIKAPKEKNLFNT